MKMAALVFALCGCSQPAWVAPGPAERAESAVDGMLLTKIPVKDPDTLVRLRFAGRNDMSTSSSDYGAIDRARYGGVNARTTFSYPMYQQFVADNKTMSDLLAGGVHGTKRNSLLLKIARQSVASPKEAPSLTRKRAAWIREASASGSQMRKAPKSPA